MRKVISLLIMMIVCEYPICVLANQEILKPDPNGDYWIECLDALHSYDVQVTDSDPEGLNCRSGPGTTYDVVQKFPKGFILTPILHCEWEEKNKKSKIDANGKPWLEIFRNNMKSCFTRFNVRLINPISRTKIGNGISNTQKYNKLRVPEHDKNGDFWNSDTWIQYTVLDQDPVGLACREKPGIKNKLLQRFPFGYNISGIGVSIDDRGKPWLMVSRSNLQKCFVRFNKKYIGPYSNYEKPLKQDCPSKGIFDPESGGCVYPASALKEALAIHPDENPPENWNEKDVNKFWVQKTHKYAINVENKEIRYACGYPFPPIKREVGVNLIVTGCTAEGVSLTKATEEYLSKNEPIVCQFNALKNILWKCRPFRGDLSKKSENYEFDKKPKKIPTPNTELE